MSDNLTFNSNKILNNGVEMPLMGFGVWQVNNATASDMVQMALKHGYRLIDTAKQYGNEHGVGEGLKKGLVDNNLTRQDVFLTTKIYNGDQGHDDLEADFDNQLRDLQTDYVDLLLIHWPVADKYEKTWGQLEDIYKKGKARAIGVSNFDVEHLDKIIKNHEIVPAVNQMEFNPRVQEDKIKKFGDANGISLEAWSPLGGDSLKSSTIKEIAEKYDKTPAQVILRWDVQRGVITIPKSSHEERLIENSDIWDFQLSDDDVKSINSMNEEKRSIWYDVFPWSGNKDANPDSIQTWSD